MNVGVEQNDLLAAAIEFGITDLVEGQKHVWVEERGHQRVNCQNLWDNCEGREGVQDAQVRAEMVERRELKSPVRATSCTSAAAVGKTASTRDREESSSEYMPVQNVDSCVTSTPQNLNIEDISNTLRSELNPSSRSANDTDSELNCSFNSLTDCTAPWSVNVATTSFDRDSNGRLHQRGGDQLQSHAIADMMESESEDQDAVLDAAEESGTSAGKPKRAEVPQVERAKSTEERSPLAGRKNLNLIKQMAQMVESTQISIKVKSFYNTLVSSVLLLKTLSYLWTLKTDCSECKLQFDNTCLLLNY